jgi:hypothetical protein
VRDHALHALAIRDRTIYVLGRPELPVSRVRIYVDCEGHADDGFIYLIGILICDGAHVEGYALLADDRSKETVIFNQFLDHVSRYDAPRLYCYGNYERAFIARMRRHARKKRVDAVLAALINVLTVIYPHVYFPTYSNGLKGVGGCLGCHWNDPSASGTQSIVWRTRWEQTGDERWKAKLIQYNAEDCNALRKVTEFLTDASARDGQFESGTTQRVAAVTELDKLARTVTWPKFAHADFKFVNKRAYFDYQRSRVFARTGPGPRRRGRATRRRTWMNRKIRPTHLLELTASTCPFCKSKDIVPIHPKRRPKGLRTRRKRAFDILVTPGAIRRKVMEIRAVAYRCSDCASCFIPERYDRVARHFHGFMSWFAYQHITHRLGVKALAALFHEAFGIQVNTSELMVFRHLLARYYRRTYQQLLAKIIGGHVLHIDETEVKLKTSTAYVWVFTNADAAIFVLRPSREGEFLRKMLKGFKGVLVSDFYSAYDGLNCLQQRCLIHLIRDMNRSILDNPFDQELQSITSPFGALLRAIVVTVDEHGLKQRHLERHSRAVTAFFQGLTDGVYETDASKALQDRLLRNRDRLFTFLHHDGVSWNNNLAENAIKRIAYYRDDVGRSIKETGLAEHLVLLSLYQTCRVREH